MESIPNRHSRMPPAGIQGRFSILSLRSAPFFGTLRVGTHLRRFHPRPRCPTHLSTRAAHASLSRGRSPAIKRGALSILLFAAIGAFGQLDPPDPVLTARLLAAADAEFSRDGRLSAFWNDWTGDSILITPEEHCYPERCGAGGPDDASMTVKAAWSAKGLYLCYLFRDDTWVEPVDGDDWGADVLDMYLDSQDADSIYRCTDCLLGLYNSTLTWCTQQWLVWMMTDEEPDRCRYAWYEPWYSWEVPAYVTFDEAEALYGFSVDVARPAPDVKAQEWFIPWYRVGCGIDDSGAVQPAVGRFAFTVGYNDTDSGSVEPDLLRWRGKDPWVGLDSTGVNYWGDIELDGWQAGAAGSVVSSSASVAPVRSGIDVIPVAADRVLVRYRLASAGAVRIDMHDMGGRLITRLQDCELAAGTHTVLWSNGTGERHVPAGVYVVRMYAGRRVLSRTFGLAK